MSPALYGVLAVPNNGDVRLPIALGVNEHVMAIGANMAVRASVLQRLGGLRRDLGKLDGSLRTGEDHELYLRLLHAGCRGVYEPTAVAGHWVPRYRLERSYCSRWLYANGRDVARLDREYPPPVTNLLGIPRYFWRRAAGDLWTAVRATISRNRAGRFAAAVRAIWFLGYLREAWFGSTAARRREIQPAGQR
jgi:hypothetical protein